MSIISRLDRHVAREILVPTVLAFFVYTFLLIMNGLFTLMEQVVVYGVSAEDALKVLLIGIPNVAILTIPVSFLFGVLLAAGRMTADNELTALLAAGIPARRLYKSVLILGLGLSLLSLYLTFNVIPDSTREMRALRTRIFTTSSVIGRVQPKVFYDEIPQLLLYVEDVDSATGTWQNVLIHRVVSPDEEQLTLARRGRVIEGQEPENGSIQNSPNNARFGDGSGPWIVLEGMVNHTFLRNHPEKLLTSTVQTHAFRPDGNNNKSNTKQTYRLTLEELNTEQLLEKSRSGRDPEELKTREDDRTTEERQQEMRMADAELHRRIAIPMAAVTFALLALPLGIGVRAGSRGRGFLYSILVVVVYYILNSYGEFLVIEKGLPAVIGMWIPNIAIGSAAVFLSLKMGRWLGERQRPEGWMSRIIRAIRGARRRIFGRSVDSGDGTRLTGSIPIGVQRRVYGGGFPTLLDRYLIRRLLSPLFLVLLSTVSLYIIGDLTNHVDEISRNAPPASVVLGYYWNLIPRALFDVLPFGVLISVITLLTVLERQQELTALKATGVSVFRITLPLLLVAIAGVGAMWTLGEHVMPEADAKSTALFDVIRGRAQKSRGSTAHRNWLVARDGRTYYRFLRYDITQKRLIRFSMFRVDSQMRLSYSLFAHRVQYDNGAWIADGGWLRNIDEQGNDDYQQIMAPTEIGIIEGPTYFGQENERPNQLSQAELRQYIGELKDSGYRPSALIVRWHQKFSTPLAVVVLVLLAIPFSLGSGGGTRASTMQGIATALALGIGYFILLVPLFAKMGEAEILPPLVGAWIPVLLGVLYAINRMTHIRS